MRKILVTGALGQIGSQLVPELGRRFGRTNVVASDVRMRHDQPINDSSAHEHLDCTDAREVAQIVRREAAAGMADQYGRAD